MSGWLPVPGAGPGPGLALLTTTTTEGSRIPQLHVSIYYSHNAVCISYCGLFLFQDHGKAYTELFLVPVTINI